MGCLGIDLGTSSFICIDYGRRTGKSTKRQGVSKFVSPRNGEAEHDPGEWWDACCETVQEVLVLSKTAKEEVKGLSFSGQMHGAVMLDQELKPVANDSTVMHVLTYR